MRAFQDMVIGYLYLKSTGKVLNCDMCSKSCLFYDLQAEVIEKCGQDEIVQLLKVFRSTKKKASDIKEVQNKQINLTL